MNISNQLYLHMKKLLSLENLIQVYLAKFRCLCIHGLSDNFMHEKTNRMVESFESLKF